MEKENCEKGTVCVEKNYFKVSDPLREFFEFWWKKNWQDCGNCISIVQINNLIKNELVERTLIFYHLEFEPEILNFFLAKFSKLHSIAFG